ncbi:22508_t:CDS:2 [Gigaspora margarita]|uniref:22508_t:CDS:1 n=1 Tax=Gigaspora margarita TaxID=4874 RepID=A0ABN7VBL6_GIGMA|nr:22508_t:CDS:2 [Gigaspora margarita]
MTEKQDDYIDNTNTLETSMEKDYLLFEAYSAEFEPYESFDENSIKSKVSGITSSCSLTIATLFEPIAQATCLLSTASYPTMANLHTIFPVILDLLDDALKQYYLSIILDPNLKLFLFATDNISVIQRTIHHTYEKYLNAQTNTSSSNFEVSNNSSRLYFKKHLKHTLTTENSEHEHDIFDKYLFSAKEDCNVLEFWKIQSNDIHYATLTQIAQDYLKLKAFELAKS